MVNGLPTFPDGNLLTHSSESCFHRCPRRYLYHYIWGIRPKHAADPLRQGGAYHTGLEAVKAGATEDAAAEAVRRTYADTTCPPWMEADAWAVEIETTVALVRGYARRWGADAIIDWIKIEKPFALKFPSPSGHPARGVRSAGKIDGIARLPDGRLALIEHKTTSEDIALASDYWRKLLMDSQISRYFWAARQLGYDVETVVYDVVRKPMIRPRNVAKADRALATSQGHYHDLLLTQTCPERETPQMFAARLLSEMAANPDWYFARNEIPRLQNDLDEFVAEQWVNHRRIADAKRLYRQIGKAAFPRNTGACTGWGRCPYLDVCRGLNGRNESEVPEGFRRVEKLHEELEV